MSEVGRLTSQRERGMRRHIQLARRRHRIHYAEGHRLEQVGRPVQLCARAGSRCAAARGALAVRGAWEEGGHGDAPRNEGR